MVPGSPLNALLIDPPFTEYHLVDLDPRKIESLRAVIGKRSDVHIHSGNCNEVLLRQVFPHLNHSDFRRALVLLDPYGLDLRWEVLQTAGQLPSGATAHGRMLHMSATLICLATRSR